MVGIWDARLLCAPSNDVTRDLSSLLLVVWVEDDRRGGPAGCGRPELDFLSKVWFSDLMWARRGSDRERLLPQLITWKKDLP